MSRLVVLSALLAAVVAVGGGSPPPPEAPAAYYFLKIEGIDGEADDGAIALTGLAWDTRAEVGRFAENPPAGLAVSDSGPGGPKTETRMDLRVRGMVGRRSHQPLTIAKQVDKASPQLMEACANGTTLVNIQLWTRDEGDLRTLRYTLKDAIITSYHIANPAGAGGVPVEQVSLNFARIEMAARGANLNLSKSNID